MARRRTLVRSPIAIAAIAMASLGLVVVVVGGLRPRAPRRAARGEAGAAIPTARAARADIAPAAPIATVGDNVSDASYVGPTRCASCHPDQARHWRDSLHATMTQRATTTAIRGDFADARLAYAGGVARFTRDGAGARMELTDHRGQRHGYRVTRTIGSRGLQEYVGVAEDDPAAVEVRLPFAWWVARAGWYPQPYYDSWFDDEYLDGRPRIDVFAADAATPWADRCAWCHNTYPFAVRMARPEVGVGPERHLAAIEPAIRDNHLPIDRLVTVGISCESCHLGGRDHAAAPDEVAPSFVPVGNAVARDAAAPTVSDRADPRVLGAICAQCHSTPSPRFPDGSAARNSSEALAMAAGTCASAIRCVDCHDPHQRGAEPGAADRAAAIAACVRCHPTLAEAGAQRAHARHAPESASCLDCHMPRLVQGIGTYVRSHRISSPTDPAMLGAGAPNACNLCHLDRSIAWTTDALASWGVAVTPQPGWAAAYGGDLDYPVGPAWLTSDQPYLRMTAAAAYARAGDRAALPMLVARLDDPRANTRMWMLFAIEDLLGHRLDAQRYDPLAPPKVRAGQVRALAAAAAR